MSDLKKLFENAKNELENDALDPVKSAIKEIIRIERRYYYADKNRAGKLKELREVVIEHSRKSENSDVDK